MASTEGNDPVRRTGDTFREPRISDALIQTDYRCDHVIAGEWPHGVHKSRTTLVHLCEDCRDKDYRLTMDGKVIITEGSTDQ
jgi:hypothetical protein